VSTVASVRIYDLAVMNVTQRPNVICSLFFPCLPPGKVIRGFLFLRCPSFYFFFSWDKEYSDAYIVVSVMKEKRKSKIVPTSSLNCRNGLPRSLAFCSCTTRLWLHESSPWIPLKFLTRPLTSFPTLFIFYLPRFVWARQRNWHDNEVFAVVFFFILRNRQCSCKIKKRIKRLGGHSWRVQQEKKIKTSLIVKRFAEKKFNSWMTIRKRSENWRYLGRNCPRRFLSVMPGFPGQFNEMGGRLNMTNVPQAPVSTSPKASS
jgi:hypothetical protein